MRLTLFLIITLLLPHRLPEFKQQSTVLKLIARNLQD